MRHNRKVNHLGRTSSHRKAMLANMATSLIMHKRIKTTVAKARALRVYVEPILTKSKEDTTHSRRVVFGYLQSKDAVTELFREISPKIMERPGGYTRILKIGTRVGDRADMCFIELVDYNENLLGTKTEAAGKTGKRKRRGAGKKKEEAETPAAKKTVGKETPAVDETPVAKETAAPEETADTKETPEEVEAAAETDATVETETEVEDSSSEKTDSAENNDSEPEQDVENTEEEKKE